MVCPSTPADPALALTSRHALAKTSSRYILSYSAWNRRVGLAFAARYRARWSSRALSRVDLARWALTSAYLPRTRRPSAAPSLHGRYPASSVPYEPLRLPLRSHPLRRLAAYRARRSQSTRRMAPHGSHCWGGDGPLLFPRGLCQRSTPPTPLVLRGCLSKIFTPSVAFAWIHETRRPVCSSRSPFFRRGRLRFMLRTAGLHPPKEGSTPRYDAQVSPNVGGLL